MDQLNQRSTQARKPSESPRAHNASSSQIVKEQRDRLSASAFGVCRCPALNVLRYFTQQTVWVKALGEIVCFAFTALRLRRHRRRR